MTKIADLPATLKPYAAHGIKIEYKDTSTKNIYCDCPFCGKPKKFSIKVDDGQWRCVACNEGSTDKGKQFKGGNVYTFLRLLWGVSSKEAGLGKQQKSLLALTKDRGLLLEDTLIKWGVCQSISSGDILFPGYGVDGKVHQLYRYLLNKQSGKRALMATPELAHQLHGVNLYKPHKSTIYLTEGPWDAATLYEVLKSTKVTEKGELKYTGNEDVSLLADINVLAVPGCGVFNEKWLPLFAGKRVVLMYDNDHPKTNPKTNQVIPPVGYESMKRVAQLLGKADDPPAEITYLKWPEDDDKDHNPDLASGYDLRDYFGQATTMPDRIKLIGPLLDKITPIPPEWIPGRSPEVAEHGGTDLECKTCHDWKTLLNAWRKAIKWTPGAGFAMPVSLATVVSTLAQGDQLWVKVVGPASCGKTTLVEAIAVSKKYAKSVSVFTGLHSGYKTDKSGDEDNSLLPQIKGKTLIIKDADTLMKQSNRDKIMSELRDLYDGKTSTFYKNKIAREYNNQRTTLLMCGTASIRSMDSSELGERFLDVVMMDGIDDDLEDEILRRATRKAHRNMKLEVNGLVETAHDPNMLYAYQLTGGYVEYLRSNAQRLLSQIQTSEEALDEIIKYAKLVAHLRARPSKSQDEIAEREMATRLSGQLTRLADCLAVVLNRKEVDDEVMAIVKKVALDTARGKTMEIAGFLYDCGKDGAELPGVITITGSTDARTTQLLQFLRKIKVVETCVVKVTKRKVSSRIRWRLTDRFRKLYEYCVLGKESVDANPA
jgi:hypothetical protein